jgi:hypothetical protein
MIKTVARPTKARRASNSPGEVVRIAAENRFQDDFIVLVGAGQHIFFDFVPPDLCDNSLGQSAPWHTNDHPRGRGTRIARH